MRQETEIHRRYRRVRYELRAEMLRERLRKAPCNCQYNYKEPEEREGVLSEGAGARFCMLGAQDIQNWPGNLCDTVENARTCPFYKAKHTRDEVLEHFESLIQDEEWLEEHAPDLATLTWVLETSEPPWYMRILDWLRGEPEQPDEFQALLTSENEGDEEKGDEEEDAPRKEET